MEGKRFDVVKNKVLIPKYFEKVIVPQMADYYSDYTVDFYNRPFVKCPLHDEATPSMKWYEETNSFYCFGCRAGGSVITLHQKFVEKINGEFPSANEALEFLERNFIEDGSNTGRVSNTLLIVKKDEEKPREDKVNMLRYYRVNQRIESSLLRDNGIGLQEKMKIWEKMDLISVLVRRGNLDPMEAKEALEKLGI